MQNKQTLIVAAIASRIYAKAAAESGFDVIAIDCFADADTRRYTKDVYQVPLHNGSLDSGSVLDIVKSVTSKYVDAVFCYGAGFEMQPMLLDKISQLIEVIGNTGQTVMHCKDPVHFFGTCDALGIPYPEVTVDLPESTSEWLMKFVGGSGGAHITPLQKSSFLAQPGYYLQRYQAGIPVSCLFVADGHDVEVVGFSEQWSDTGNVEAPYRYGGAVNQADLSALAKKSLTRYAEQVTRAAGLVGLNSCDAICDGDVISVLEINPRLSATVELYLNQWPDLMTRHIAASTGWRLKDFVNNSKRTRNAAHQVVYADRDIVIPHNFLWPAWAKDIPEAGSKVNAGMPVCTVVVEAKSVEKVRRIVQDKAATLGQQLLN